MARRKTSRTVRQSRKRRAYKKSALRVARADQRVLAASIRGAKLATHHGDCERANDYKLDAKDSFARLSKRGAVSGRMADLYRSMWSNYREVCTARGTRR